MSEASTRNLDIAVERVVGFAQKFDRAHFDLACHAAFPQTLTPDLIYQIWLRFVPQAPWTAVARVLLSRLCREVGYELYEMDVAVRNLLLTELKKDEQRFNKDRLGELADFYTNYLKQQLGSEESLRGDLTQAQYWIPIAYTKPKQLNRELAKAIQSRLKEKNWKELFRLASFMEAVPEALVEFEAPLITYARGMLSFTTGDIKGAREQFKKLPRLGRERKVNIVGVTLSIPDEVGPLVEEKHYEVGPLVELEKHYESIIKAIIRGRLVPFLGSDINLCDRIQADGKLVEPWKPDCLFPPSGKELTAYLAKTFPPQAKPFVCPLCNRENLQETATKPGGFPEGCPMNELIHEDAVLICPLSKESLTVRGRGLNLPYLSQYAMLTHPVEFYEQLYKLKLASQPNQLHKFLATMSRIMREKGYYPPYPLIVTANYDCALEQAFKEAGEPFDLVFYSNTIDAQEQDRFVHQTPDGTLYEIVNPNEYQGLSFEQRPVILKLYGSIDRIQEGESLIITEEHFLEYLVTRNISNLLPVTILRKLRSHRPNILFLGYPIGEWYQRIILHRIWQDLTSSQSRKRYPWWAIQSNVEPFAQKLWETYGVILYDLPLRDYITELEKRVRDIPAKGDKGHE